MDLWADLDLRNYENICSSNATLMPDHSSINPALNKSGSPDRVALSQVDATEEKELGTKYKVQGYPTLKWFVNGKPTEFGGARTA